MTTTETPRAWPTPPLVLPRGPRELAWHLAAGLALAPILSDVGAWLFLLAHGITSFILQLTPRRNLCQALLYLLLAASYYAGRGDIDQLPRYLVLLLVPDPSEVAYGFGGLLLLAAWAALAISVLQRFDIRAVNHDVVDDRVWRRQQARRQQILRAEHRQAELPLLAP